jgi:hypothetical protein
MDHFVRCEFLFPGGIRSSCEIWHILPQAWRNIIGWMASFLAEWRIAMPVAGFQNVLWCSAQK